MPIRSGSAVLPILTLLAAMASFQLGAALAKQLFPLVGPQGASALRLALSACVLFAVTRPWRGALGAPAIRFLLAYGGALAGLNFFFYLALQRIPLAVAVAIDFIGPLSVAILYSRRWIDLLWVILAGFGIVLLLGLGGKIAALDPVGVLFCLCAAASWALYIIFGQKAGSLLPSGRATALGVGVAALLVFPFGVAEAGAGLFSLAVLPVGAAVAVLSSALPNSLEMAAMKRLPTRLFGVLMSLEPAFGALCGWLVLGESLSTRQGAAIACVMLASAGATLTTPRIVPVADA